ncbi:MAG: ATP-binding cassette domain-containing protein [Anaerolineae bacterium]|nr:ATP-binding cassette domain-containing protein [Anaerolineae bacterium]
MNPFIQVQNLQKQYNPPEGVFAVGKNGGVNFEIYEGEIFSLLGPNGAGKTTCISMMSTLLIPTGGDVIIGGYSVTQKPVQAKQQIGVVPQELALYPTLSARQNLEFFGRMYGLGGKDLKKRADEVLALIDLSDRANDKIEEYSGGMKRRVNIGIGLMHRPKMVFLDEPTVAIDPQSRRRILDTVKQLNEEGMTVLYTTHYMEEAQELSDRIAIIDYGEIITMGELGELIQQVGEKDTLIFKVSEVAPAVLEKINALELVDHTISKPDEGELHVISPRGRKILPEVINLLTDNGTGLYSVEVQEPNLEAVFLSLTGRALRE